MYTDITKKIDRIENSTLTIDNLKELARINGEINDIYIAEKNSGRIDAKIRFNTMKGKLYELAFIKLKEKLDFDNEIIDVILYFLSYVERINEIYVLDGNVIIKMISNNDSEKKISYFVSTNGFMDVESKKFTNDFNDISYKEYYVKALNNAIMPYLNKEILKIQNNEIVCLPNVKLYSDYSLRDVMLTKTYVLNETVKIILDDNEQLYSFDMKVGYGNFYLIPNSYPISKILELLDNKDKIKKL